MSVSEAALLPGQKPHRQQVWFRVLAIIAAILIVLMIAVTCIDVIGRYLLNRPFGGAYELTQMLLAALVFVALPLTTVEGSHVEVDLALHLFSPRTQMALGRIAGVISAAVLAYFTYRLLLIGLNQLQDGTHSASLGLPMAPLAFLAAASCAYSAFLLLFRRA